MQCALKLGGDSIGCCSIALPGHKLLSCTGRDELTLHRARAALCVVTLETVKYYSEGEK